MCNLICTPCIDNSVERSGLTLSFVDTKAAHTQVVAFSRVKISLNFNELRHTPILNIYNKISTYIVSAKEKQNVHSKYNSKDSNCRQRPRCYHTQKAVSNLIFSHHLLLKNISKSMLIFLKMYTFKCQITHSFLSVVASRPLSTIGVF